MNPETNLSIRCLDYLLKAMLYSVTFLLPALYFLSDKGVALGSVGLYAAILFLVFVLRNTPYAGKLWKLSFAAKALVFFFMWAAASALWSVYFDVSFKYTLLLASAIVFYVVFSSVMTDSRDRLIWIYALSLFAFLFCCFVTFSFLSRLFFPGKGHPHFFITSSFVYYQAFFIPVLFALFLRARGNLKPVCLLAFSSLVCFTFLTQNIGCWLQISFSMFFYFFLVFKKLSLPAIEKRILFASCLICLGITLGLASVQLVPFFSRIVSGEKTFASNYISLFALIGNQPFLGTGIGSYDLATTTTSIVLPCKNFYLQLWQEIGAVGLALFAFCFVTIFVSAKVQFVQQENRSEDHIVFFALFSAVCGFLLSQFFSSVFFQIVPTIIVFIFCACFSFSQNHLETDSENLLGKRGAYFIYCLVLFVAGGLLFYSSCNQTQGSIFAQKGKKLLEKKYYLSAVQAYETALSYQPANALYYEKLSQVHYQHAMTFPPQERSRKDILAYSIDAMKKVTQINPYWPLFYRELGFIYASNAEYEKSKEMQELAKKIQEQNKRLVRRKIAILQDIFYFPKKN